MLSPESARRAEAMGYTNVKIFHDGMPAWKKGGLLILSQTASLKGLIEKDISHVLIDLRSVEEAKAGHIKGAVSVPAKELAGAKDRFPADKSAMIILYSENENADAFKTVREWGYKDTSVLYGGIGTWKKAGNQLVQGEPETKIVYVYKPRPGEIAIEEFKTIAETATPGKLIVDVREEDEAMHGMLKGALNIPVGKIEEKIAQLPKDREILVHCVTGIRAEMAYDKLKAAGYKTRFLNAVIQIDKDGKYEITKK